MFAAGLSSDNWRVARNRQLRESAVIKDVYRATERNWTELPVLSLCTGFESPTFAWVCLYLTPADGLSVLYPVYTIEQTSSKCIQNTRANCSTFARCLLDRVNGLLRTASVIIKAPPIASVAPLLTLANNTANASLPVSSACNFQIPLLAEIKVRQSSHGKFHDFGLSLSLCDCDGIAELRRCSPSSFISSIMHHRPLTR